jgi:hypothetical protein
VPPAVVIDLREIFLAGANRMAEREQVLREQMAA